MEGEVSKVGVTNNGLLIAMMAVQQMNLAEASWVPTLLFGMIFARAIQVEYRREQESRRKAKAKSNGKLTEGKHKKKKSGPQTDKIAAD